MPLFGWGGVSPNGNGEIFSSNRTFFAMVFAGTWNGVPAWQRREKNGVVT